MSICSKTFGLTPETSKNEKSSLFLSFSIFKAVV
jgi:hypothetical protein